jgi:septal ring factor EnvC (AmiA/AmiB activator)
VAFYQYLAFRLQSIARDVKYPREDILEVRDRLRGVEALLERLRQQLDPDLLDSLTATQQRQLQALRQDLTDVAASQESLRVRNQSEHEQLARDAEAAISRLNADAEFLDRARELIRFFKEA